jgi:arsenate reductase
MADAAHRWRVLFLCTGNSCRSQMAEGWARALWPDRLEPWSAGTRPQPIHPLAVQVMAEAGVDIAAQRSKSVDTLGGLVFDAVVTVCDAAREACPHWPGVTRKIHAGFDDPPRLASQCRTVDEALPHYRRVRDEIREFILTLPQTLDGERK